MPLLLDRLVEEAAESQYPSCLVCRRQHFNGEVLHCGLDVAFPVNNTLRYAHGSHFKQKAKTCSYYSRFPDAIREA